MEACLMADENFDILCWWKLNFYKYPILSEMAQIMLAVPISIVVSENFFNTGGRVLDVFQSSLSPQHVEGLICAQNWLKSSSTTSSRQGDHEYVATIEELGSALAAKIVLE